jgi:hypothetical protein
MANRSSTDGVGVSASPRVFELSPELEAELRQAVADIERGDCLELTPEQLKGWAETGELAVLDEWLAESHV